MIDLYFWTTPNGYKVSILLEELALPYRVLPVDIGAGEQFQPSFLALNPNHKIPVIVDRDGPGGAPYTVIESGAILMYLAEKTGRFFPAEPRAHWDTVQWLMFQMASIGPMLGQNHHFRRYAPEKIEYAIQRYTNEAKRLYGVMDKRLTGRAWFAGDEYTIADIAIFPWLRGHASQGVDLDGYPNVKRWFEAVAARPAVQRGLAVLADRPAKPMDAKAREALFGAKQYEKR